MKKFMIFGIALILLAAIGLISKQYIRGNDMKKILIVETNVCQYGDNSSMLTGVWLEEITSFYDVVTKAGYKVDFGSPLGGKVCVDPASAKADDETMRIFNDPVFHKEALENTKKLNEDIIDIEKENNPNLKQVENLLMNKLFNPFYF